uniref:Uncharacterized protein n=1 Tax=Rhizophora mucronata TaxID=61149 RepID=A0A2P2NVC0_RHIMU
MLSHAQLFCTSPTRYLHGTIVN